MTPEVLWSFGRIGGMQVSPDGKTFLYRDMVQHRRKQIVKRYLLHPGKGGEPKNLTNSPGNEMNAVWRPDGKKIGYLSAASGSVQMWEMNPTVREQMCF
jgi:Tol biopolymer transport system component